jgi:hypothetical protein
MELKKLQNLKFANNSDYLVFYDCLCGTVVRVPGYRSRHLGSILSSSGSGTEYTQLREYNWEATWKKKWRLRWPRSNPLSEKVGTNFADKRR